MKIDHLLPLFLLCLFSSFDCFSQNSENQEQLDSLICGLEITSIKPGYYYHRRVYSSEEEKFYNEVDWIHISKNNEVQLFYTMNGEYCYMDMNFSKNPKKIKRQIEQNREEFKQLSNKCKDDQMFPSSKINRVGIISLNPIERKAMTDALCFVKDGLVRRTEGKDNLIYSDEYKFAGK